MKHPSQQVVLGDDGTIAFEETLERLATQVPCSQMILSTTLPRGGLQVLQARNAEAAWLRAYSREFHLLDAVAWEALRCGEPRRLSADHTNGDAAAQATLDRFRDRALASVDLTHCIAAPVDSPLLEGYPGVVQLFRTAAAPDFTIADHRVLTEFGESISAAAARVRQARRGENAADKVLAPDPPLRQAAVTCGRQWVYPDGPPPGFDPTLQDNLRDTLERRLEDFQRENRPLPRNGRAARPAAAGESIPRTQAGRLIVPDETGDQWVFRLVLYEFFPALTYDDRPVAVASLPPECDSWAELRPSDFGADPELARLIPALHYMHKNFANGINLTKVAQSVELSPFHFHRRFTELLGTTPKHFLFDCQILQAKRHLSEGERPLTEIATAAGFAHQSHFTSRFRQATGFTPTRWRRLIRSRQRAQA
jgi:AraC-like DNA-binding protein